MNLFTEKADDDGCVDEKTWSFSGMGGKASGQIKRKLGVTKVVRLYCFLMLVNAIQRHTFIWNSLVKENDGFS